MFSGFRSYLRLFFILKNYDRKIGSESKYHTITSFFRISGNLYQDLLELNSQKDLNFNFKF